MIDLARFLSLVHASLGQARPGDSAGASVFACRHEAADHGLEPLEARVLMSVSIETEGDKLIVRGTGAMEHIVIYPDDAGVRVGVRIDTRYSAGMEERSGRYADIREVVVYGGAGGDQIRVDRHSDAVVGEISYAFYGGPGGDMIYGSNGDDWIEGGPGSDVLFGFDGNDRLSGGGGYDAIFGGSDDDELLAGAGFDYLDGEGGDDRLVGDERSDRLFNGSGAHDDLGALGALGALNSPGASAASADLYIDLLTAGGRFSEYELLKNSKTDSIQFLEGVTRYLPHMLGLTIQTNLVSGAANPSVGGTLYPISMDVGSDLRMSAAVSSASIVDRFSTGRLFSLIETETDREDLLRSENLLDNSEDR